MIMSPLLPLVFSVHFSVCPSLTNRWFSTNPPILSDHPLAVGLVPQFKALVRHLFSIGLKANVESAIPRNKRKILKALINTDKINAALFAPFFVALV